MKQSLEKQQKYYELGETYFWLASHYDIVMAWATPKLKEKAKAGKIKILDAGCGPGNLASKLLPWGEVVGADASADALEFCKQKHFIDVKQITTKQLPFPDNSFDLIFAIEVIEHIEDDIFAMQELKRVLKPNGYLIVTVPAFMFLWGSHDEWNEHYRRYTKKRLSRVALSAGFEIERLRYMKLLFFIPLLLLRFLKKGAKDKQRQDDFYALNPTVNRFFRLLINWETPIVSNLPLPLGCSIIGLFHKAS
jgi:SAM-dependent methyltransferase